MNRVLKLNLKTTPDEVNCIKTRSRFCQWQSLADRCPVDQIEREWQSFGIRCSLREALLDYVKSDETAIGTRDLDYPLLDKLTLYREVTG